MDSARSRELVQVQAVDELSRNGIPNLVSFPSNPDLFVTRRRAPRSGAVMQEVTHG